MENNTYTGSWLSTLKQNVKVYNQTCITNMTKQGLLTSIKDYYINKWNTDNKRDNSKLRTYSTFKNSLDQAEYITLINNRKHIKTMTQFRISCHKLAIETGRHTQPKTPVEDRLCRHCNETEDEQHHLIHCKLYTKQRETMFNTIQNINPKFIQTEKKEQFKLILQSKQAEIIIALSIYLNTCK